MMTSARNKHDEIYIKYLTTINGIRFTSREADILSCIVCTRGEKKIASICSISPKTVNVHIYNIMNKLQCNSREQIVDFTEKSGTSKIFREYYSHLLARHSFELSLSKISKLIAKDTIWNVNISEQPQDEQIYKYIEKDLSFAGIKLLYVHKNSKDVLDITKIRLDHYYEDIISLFIDSLPKEKLDVIISEFKDNLLSTKKLSTGPIIPPPLPSDKLSLLKAPLYTLLKKYYVFVLAIIITTATIAHIQTSYVGRFDKTSMENAIKDMQTFIEISKTDNFTANNIDKEQVTKNQSLIKKVEKLSNYRNMKSIQDYLAKAEMPPELVLSYMHALQALASYYMYNQHNGNKAEEILLHAKYVAENYVNKRNNLPLVFSKLQPEEILSEMQIIKCLPQLYTRVLYSLGRTTIYTKGFDNGLKYFETSKYLGTKLGLFEGYLSDTSGILALEMRKELDVTKPESEAARLRNLLSSFENIQKNNNTYILDYNPNLENQKLITPSTDKYNIMCCHNNILSVYSNLILIDKPDDLVKDDIEIARIAHEASLVIEHSAQRQRAFFYNIIATNIVSLFDRGHKNTASAKEASKMIGSKYIDDLDTALNLYELAKSISREADYTKADAYDGASKVLQKKMEITSLSESEKLQILEKINDYQSSRDAINKALSR